MDPGPMRQRRLHSTKAPLREAERQLESIRIKGEKDPGLIILIDPGMDYLSLKVQDLFPEASCLSLYTLHEQFQERLDSPHPAFLFPDSKALLSWLELRLPSFLLRDPRFLIHPVNRLIRRTFYEALEEELHALVRKTQAELITTGHFSPALLRNLRRNLGRVSLKGAPEFHKTALLPVVAASGPSLADHADFLLAEREGIFLISLPSSLSFLESKGIWADALVSIDQGYWACRQLDRSHRENFCEIWAGLGSCLPTRDPGKLRFFPSDNPLHSYFEVRNTEGLPEVSEAATVSATAIELAQALFGNPVLVLGMDLSTPGLASHVHPHNFDAFHDSRASRIRPIETQRLGSALHARSSLEIYLQWFMSQSGRWKGSVFQPSGYEPTGLDEIERPEDLLGRERSLPQTSHRRRLPPDSRSLLASVEALGDPFYLLKAGPGEFDQDYLLRQLDFFAYKDALAGKEEGKQRLRLAIKELGACSSN